MRTWTELVLCFAGVLGAEFPRELRCPREGCKFKCLLATIRMLFAAVLCPVLGCFL